MENLSSFLHENLENEIIEEIALSNRFKDEEGNIIKWKIKSISTLIDEELRALCYNKDDEFDYNKYLGKLTARCTLYPNLNSVELQNSYKVYDSDSCLKQMLLPGEYANLVEKVQQINGFNQTFDELVDIAKN